MSDIMEPRARLAAALAALNAVEPAANMAGWAAIDAANATYAVGTPEHKEAIDAMHQAYRTACGALWAEVEAARVALQEQEARVTKHA